MKRERTSMKEASRAKEVHRCRRKRERERERERERGEREREREKRERERRERRERERERNKQTFFQCYLPNLPQIPPQMVRCGETLTT
ncbi:hypothetical protein CLOM_g1746 [Closterium sp. NIES-68]|nr:hypothetical protein CLOM_g1746 [Closterium sp. NIES-68]